MLMMVEAKEVNFSFYITEKCFTLIGEALLFSGR